MYALGEAEVDDWAAGPSAATTAPAAGGVTPHLGPVNLTVSVIDRGLQFPNDYWSAGQFTFSIPAAGASWPSYASNEEPYDPHFAGLTTAQAQVFRAALAAWDSLIAPNFTETNDVANPGNIRVAFSGYSDLQDDWGYTYAPPIRGASPQGYQGDIWINADYVTSDFYAGSYDYESLLHELGHALGLKHSFEAPVIPTAYDSTRYTVMSYTEPQDSVAVSFLPTADGGVGSAFTSVLASTPMVLDVQAIQDRYGADLTTAAGDTTYRFTTAKPFLYTLYDAGGNDTLDLSAMGRGSIIDLEPGSYSSVGYLSAASQQAAATAFYGPYYADFIASVFTDLGTQVYTWADNFGIAFSTVVENVVGSASDDVLLGNQVANHISGGGGDDVLGGGPGDDVLDGGAGMDIAVYTSVSTDYSWTQTATGWTVRDLRAGAPEGVDTLTGVEQLKFTDRTVTLASDALIGTANADTLTGGPGADVIYGLDGDDQLTGGGGDDRIDGETGVDTAVYSGSSKDHVWWSNADGTWTVKDIRAGSPDGTDTLRNVEQLKFSDTTIHLTGLTTADIVNTAFQNVMMYAPTSPDDTKFIAGLVDDIVNGGAPYGYMVSEIVYRAEASSAVASIAYEFFTGATPSKGGFDYLVSPGGPNPNNLNSDYYKSFNIENRYINFAVNLGKYGDGKAQFAAQYGALSLFDATRQAYTTIFGAAPSDDKVHSILDAASTIGGQTLTRADYFASYGQDGVNGIGTKAAMVGWLLTEAVKADLGTYALSNDAFLADLADGADFGGDIVGIYGRPEYAFPTTDTAPTLASSSPADNAKATPVNANIVLTFNEAVKAGFGSIEIHYSSDGSLAALVSITDPDQVVISGATVTLNLASDLDPGTKFYVNVGYDVIEDLTNHPFDGLYGKTALDFTTAGAGAGVIGVAADAA